MKLLGVIFSSDLSWRACTRTVCSKLSKKFAVLRRIGCSLDTRTRAHIFKAYIKPGLDHCLPVWGNFGTVQATAVNKLLLRTKRIILRVPKHKTVELLNSDFKTFCLADFNNIVFLTIVYQFHHCIYSGLNCCDFKLLSEVNLSNLCTRASAANKCEINKNKKCCDNSFIYLAPKLWNRLDNTIKICC